MDATGKYTRAVNSSAFHLERRCDFFPLFLPTSLSLTLSLLDDTQPLRDALMKCLVGCQAWYEEESEEREGASLKWNEACLNAKIVSEGGVEVWGGRCSRIG